MLLGGDELGRSQAGNNNAWCQDNELSWYDWESIDHGLLEFVRRLIQIRQTEPVFRRRDFLVGEEATRSGLPDVLWMRADGAQVTDEDWGRQDARAIGVFLNGQEIPNHDRNGNPITGASFLLLFNAGPAPVTFAIPKLLGRKWTLELSTDPGSERALRRRRANLPVASRSIVVLRQIARDTDSAPEPRAPAQE
jgi:glycogen operon protein